jgi:hypothetical protein
MSRGHGHVERAILEALRWKKRKRGIQQGMLALGTDVELLAHYVQCGEAMDSVHCPHRAVLRDKTGAFVLGEAVGFHPTRSDIESVRRALRMRMQGLVVGVKVYHGKFSYVAPRRTPNCPG